MKRFKDMINKFYGVMGFYEELYETQAIVLEPGSNGLQYILQHGRLSRLQEETVLLAFEQGTANATELYLMMNAVGPGIFIFKHEQLGQLGFELLEEIDLNIEIDDFKMPFQCINIELPPNYIKNKLIQCPQAGEEMGVIGYNGIYPEMHQPISVTIVHDPDNKMLLCGVIYDSEQTIKIALVGRSGSTISQLMSENLLNGGKRFSDSLETTDDEWLITARCVQASLNLCLLMDEVSVKKIGPENPAYYDRLIRHVEAQQKAYKRATREKDYRAAQRAKEILINNRTAIKRTPLYYELAKIPNLYVIDHLPAERTVSGAMVTPHRRRGFYKLQPHGPRNSLRKRIRIPPVFVNKHLLGIE